MTQTRRFDWLLFDLGGVVIDFTGPADLAAHLADGSDAATIKRRLGEDRAWRAFERGEIEADDFARQFLAAWPVTYTHAEFLRVFATWSNRYLPGAESLLDVLAPQARLACLSNTNPLHWRRNLEIFRVAERFEHCFASHLLGRVKPEPEIYRHAIATLAVPAERIAFFDDSPVNIAAAAREGLAAYLVDGVDELRQTLRELGLNVAPPGAIDPSRGALV